MASDRSTMAPVWTVRRWATRASSSIDWSRCSPILPPRKAIMTASDPFVIDDYRQVYDNVALPVLIIDHASWRHPGRQRRRARAVRLRAGGVRRPLGTGGAPSRRPCRGHQGHVRDAPRILEDHRRPHWRKDRSLFTADVWSRDTVVDGRPVRIATIHEVTERVQIQRELQQAQKMEVVGQLAAGVAHDFNNTLTVILGGSELLMEQFRTIRTPGRSRGHPASGRAGVGPHPAPPCVQPKAGDARRDLLSRRGGRAQRALLERVLTDHIEIRSRIDPDSWPVRVDATQLEHVIVNLAVNAQDAMPEGGALVLAAGNVTVSPEDARKDPRIPPGTTPS
jgi:signal transduction histidine kinase